MTRIHACKTGCFLILIATLCLLPVMFYQIEVVSAQSFAQPDEIMFIDASVHDYNTIVHNAPANIEVIILDDAEHEMNQITAILAARDHLAAIHLISHGNNGALKLGNRWLSADNLDHYATQLQRWGVSLAAGGDFLLYGCNIAKGNAGHQFVQRFARLTAADVLASDDLTGAADQGGDWNLEYKQGVIETAAYHASGFQTLLVAPTLTAGFRDDFTDTLFDGWTQKTTPGSEAMVGGFLLLTPVVQSQNGALLFNTPIDSSKQMVVEFRYESTGGAVGADGISFFLVNGAVSSFSGGVSGGSLGYAGSIALGLPGVAGGWFGIGLDEFGGFCGTTGIFLRGSEAFSYPCANGVQKGLSETSMGGNVIDGGFRRVKVTLGAAGIDALKVEWDFNDDGFYDYTPINTVLSNNNGTATVWIDARPATLKFGFAASTGLYTNRHQIDWFQVTTGSTVGSDLAYVEGVGAQGFLAVALNNRTMVLNDVDSLNLISAKVWISNNYIATEDELLFTAQNGITGVFSNGILTLSGTASVANYQLALRSVQYRNTSQTPSTLVRKVVITATDGVSTSANFTMNINVTASNDPPVVVDDAATTTQNTIVTIANVLSNDSDPEAGVLSISAADPNSVQGGTVTNNGNGAFSYLPPANFSGNDSFTYTASDPNGGSTVGTVNVSVQVNAPPLASAVSITDTNGGSVVPGDTLVGSYTYHDADGDLEGATTFRWLRNGTAIAGATVSSYIFSTLDPGATISFEVTPVAQVGATPGIAVHANLAGSGPVTNEKPVVMAVSIIDSNGGNVVVGDQLLGSYTYNDADGDLQGASAFRWLRGGTAIAGETGGRYRLSAADSGAVISFEVTPVALSGASPGIAVLAALAGGGTVSNSAPQVSGVNIVDSNGGSALAGDQLVGNYIYRDADGDPEGATTFRWLRNSIVIVGASASNYTLVTAVGSNTTLTFEVTPVASSGVSPGTVVQANLARAGESPNGAPQASNVAITDSNGGVTVVGDRLVGSYVYHDLDGDKQGTSTFRWLRGGVAIAGATGSSYILSAADSGASITFEVTPVALTGTSPGTAVQGSLAGTVLIANSAPQPSAVNITDSNGGSLVVGDNLVGSYIYHDADGDLEGVSTFRWLRNGGVIATSANYTLTTADNGTTLKFEVIPVALTGASPGTAVQATLVVPGAPVNQPPQASAVSITDSNGGSVVVGDSLVGNYTYFDSDSDVEGTTTFRWLRNGVAIAGATSSNYTITLADSGTTLKFEVIPVALTGASPGIAVQATLSGTGTVANAAPQASGVSITDSNGGSAVVGDQLVGGYTYHDVETDLQGTSIFRWLRNGVAITGATSATYILTIADSGTTIKFEVSPVALTGASPGTAVQAMLAGSGLVSNSVPQVSGVKLSNSNAGSAAVGDQLVGSYSYRDADADLEGSSTFRWLRAGVAIANATGGNYILQTADIGAVIAFEVTPVALTGTSPGTAVQANLASAGSAANQAPQASAVSITDSNAGSAVIGDQLIGHYTYLDGDADLEGASLFRWLRGGVAIANATASSYILQTADSGTAITFEVTPVALTGTSPGTSVQAILAGSGLVANAVPQATAVNIIDSNGGLAEVGDSLKGSYAYDDRDGDLEGGTSFRWLRNGVVIVGATASSYTLSVADSGAAIAFEITPLALTGTSPGTVVRAVLRGTGFVSNVAPQVSAVNLSDSNGGSAAIGDQLVGSYVYYDIDDDLQGASSFRWLRAGVAIAGATGINYVLKAADIGVVIAFEVTPLALTGTSPGRAVKAVLASAAANQAPQAASVAITDNNGGSAVVDDQLTGSYSYHDGNTDLEGASTFRWLRDGVAIAGAIGRSYTLRSADSGATIKFEVTPVAMTGVSPGIAVQATLAGTGSPSNQTPRATAVTITDSNAGSAVVGDQLLGGYSYADVDMDAEATSTFRWLSNGAAIAGATGINYTLTTADSGTTIKFEVTPVALTGVSPGTAVQATLAGSGLVSNSAPQASGVKVRDSNGGSAVVGDKLVGGYSYRDTDADSEGSSTFRWLRAGVAIAGATGGNYVLQTADVGAVIAFEVTPVALTGTSPGTAVQAKLASAGSAANQAPLAASVAITDSNAGSSVVGDELIGSYAYHDADTDLEGASLLRWLRGGVAIAGATGRSYTLTTADSGAAIQFEVTPIALTGVSPGTVVLASLAGAGAVVANSAPLATAVRITDSNGGNAAAGDNLLGSFSYRDVDGDAAGVSTFRWLRNGTAIAGATSANYRLTAADKAATIKFEVTPVAAAGTSPGTPVQAVLAATGYVLNSVPQASAVKITDSNAGSSVVGDNLLGSYVYHDVNGDMEGTTTLRWLRNGSPIAGATSASYILTAADDGATIKFEVVPVALTGDNPGSAVKVRLAGTGPVLNSIPQAVSVKITDSNGGSVLVGDRLVGSYVYRDVDGDLEGSSSFRWLRNGIAITGARGSNYTLSAADSSATIAFEVTPLALTGTSPGTAVQVALAVAAPILNFAPQAVSVKITDSNGGSVLVGDRLVGSYVYRDVDGDLEGSSSFRWLRNGTAITGATGSSYMLSAADSSATIAFEVTPIALTGASTGSAVQVTLAGVVNSSPVAKNDSMTTTVNTRVTSANVLTNDFDANADPLTITSVDSKSVQGGTVVNNNNATFTYTPLANFIGSDSFTYTINDGKGGQAVATVQINVAGTGRISVGGAGGCSLSGSNRDVFDPLLPLLLLLSLLWMKKRREL